MTACLEQTKVRARHYTWPITVSLCLLVLTLNIIGCQSSSGPKKPSATTTLFNAVTSIPAITVSGNQVLFGGQAGSVIGMSLFWGCSLWGDAPHYWTAKTVETMKIDWGANIIRAPVGVEEQGGCYKDQPKPNMARAKTVIEAAIANRMYVIIDWHSHYAYLEKAPGYKGLKADAIDFFTQIATQYGHHNNIIYEIYNEPKRVSWDEDVRPYAVELVRAIRKIDPDNLIVIGTPTWSQDVDIAAMNPVPGKNIAYALHFYAQAELHREALRAKARKALKRGIALFGTEWGLVDANGDGPVNHEETQKWMAFFQKHNISSTIWAINNKDESSAAFAPGTSVNGPWPDSVLTESGLAAKRIISTWPNTPSGLR